MVITWSGVNLCRLNHVRRICLICLEQMLAGHVVHIHALKFFGDRNAIGQISRTAKGVRFNNALALLAVGSRNLHVAARNASTRSKASRREGKRNTRIVLSGPCCALRLIYLAPGVILSIVFALRHSIDNRAAKSHQHDALGDVRTIGVVEPRDHVERFYDTCKAGANVPLATRLTRNRSRLGPRIVIRQCFEQARNVVGRLADMPEVKERAALKAWRRGNGAQPCPNTLKNAR